MTRRSPPWSTGPMSLTTCHVSVSLDGFLAGPDQSLDNPIGVDGMRLHGWHLNADESGYAADVAARDDLLRQRGAVVMGRNMFGPIRGEWSEDWRGWWGDEPPYHAPVFVLTHHPRESIEMQGGTTFHFVTDGFDAAYARAREAAGDGGDRHRRWRVDDSSGAGSRRPRRADPRRLAGPARCGRTALRRRHRPRADADRGDVVTVRHAPPLPRAAPSPSVIELRAHRWKLEKG